MTSIVWINILLGVPFVLAIVGIPLWLTWQRTDTAPDHTAARRYLASKSARRSTRTLARQS